jgi:carbonic anhydrase
MADHAAGAASPPLESPRGTLSSDILASLVVFLVAVPLGLGIALASGAPSVLPGLIACAVGGIVAGIFGGAPLQVTGPAAGLTVIVYGLIQQFGWQTMCAITIAAGGLQVIFGSLRVSRACLAISPAVVHGMLAGIGVTITLAQLHVLLGDKPNANAWSNLKDLPHEIATLHTHSAFLGLLTIAIIIGWQYLPKKIRLIPGALIGVVVSTIIAETAWRGGTGEQAIARVTLPEKLFDFAWPTFPTANMNAFLIAAATVAVVASVESLLCAVATDKMHSGPRADLDKEVIGQGLTNLTSGFLGGLPVTGVIVRSSANISAGAKTRLSAILHGVWVIVFAVFFSSLITKVPLAALAGLLVHVGVRLVNFHHIKELKNHGELAVYLVTLFGVTFTNLLEGVALGIALSFLLLSRRLSQSDILVENKGERWHVRLTGSITFLAVPRLTAKLAEIPSGAPVDIDLMADFMDHAAFDALHGWRQTHEKLGGKVDIDEIHEQWYDSAAKGDPLSTKQRKAPLLARLRSPLRKQEPEGESFSTMINNVVNFNTNVSEDVQPLFARLADEGQTPNVLFIGCCDSRVNPEYYLHSGPGDLFVLRNIGNLIPTHDSVQDGLSENSVSATLEFALGVLGVENIILCGHSECGAMRAVSQGSPFPGDGGLTEWLKIAAPSKAIYDQNPTDSKDAHNALAKINVLQQLEHLRTYPEVRRREEEGRLHLWGWFFDIKQAVLQVYDDQTNAFVKLDEAKARQMLHREADNLPKLETVKH